MADVSINVGTEGSSLDRSNITVGDVAGGNIDRRLSDHFSDRLKEVEREIKEIKSFLAGSSMGEPGLTQRVNEALSKIRAMEKDLDMLDVIDERLDKQEDLFKELRNILTAYQPMLEEMRMTYRSKAPIPVGVLYAVTVLLFLAVLIVYWAVWVGRG